MIDRRFLRYTLLCLTFPCVLSTASSLSSGLEDHYTAIRPLSVLATTQPRASKAPSNPTDCNFTIFLQREPLLTVQVS
jgi:hypothetical protein